MADDHASSREQETAARRIRVLLPLPLPEALDYLGPEGSSPPEPGSFVNVPLGQRSLTGVVWDGVGEELPEDPRGLSGLLDRAAGSQVARRGRP